MSCFHTLCLGKTIAIDRGLTTSGKIPVRSLGIITAPDDEAAARIKAIEYFHIESALQLRVVATKLAKSKSALAHNLLLPLLSDSLNGDSL
jgi:hypothetical protein